MGSLLGNYVHFNWSRYKKYGTARDETEVRSGSSYSTGVFNKHRRETIQKIQSMQTLSNLKQLEKEYNDGARQINKFISDCLTMAKSGTSGEDSKFIYALLEKVNQSWTKEVAECILHYLEFDKPTESWKYNPPSSEVALQKDMSEMQKIKSSLKRTARIHLEVLISHLNSIKIKIDNMQDGALKTSLLQECKEYLELLNEGQQSDKWLAQSLDKIWKKSSSQKYPKGFFTMDGSTGVLNQLLYKINLLTSKTVSAISIENQIGADMAEFIGEAVGQQITQIGKTEIADLFKNFILSNQKTAGSQTTSKGAISGLQVYLGDNQKLLAQLYEKGTSGIAKKGSKKYGDINYSISALSDEVQRKADFTVEIEHNTIGVSMKNTDLSAIERFEQKIQANVPATIHLQNSSLLLYLGAIELESSGLGTHYLQILSQQKGYTSKNSGVPIQNMRRSANKALALYILWSAMTGRGQARGDGAEFADILAVYDKASNNGQKNFRRIKLFSMRELLHKLITPQAIEEYVHFSPSILTNQLLLNNRWVSETEDTDSKEASDIRILALLAEARSKTIEVSLAKKFLNDFSNGVI